VAAIPAILRLQDVRACAQTGSGKTAAFALPMLQRLLGEAAANDRQVSGLVLVPTRELATQVGESFRVFSRYLPQPIKVLTVFGGVSINRRAAVETIATVRAAAAAPDARRRRRW
jgi:superfamily II DNA/RNA helicase